MKKTITHSLLAALLLTSLTAPSLSGRAQTRKPKSRALLVGINRYQQHPTVKNTGGAEEDALETAAFIKQQYGFADDDIHLLLGAKATAQAIRDEFSRWLIKDTQPGDRVFFLYAGHGSQMKDTNGDEPDGYDEVLAPFDVNWRGDGFVNVIVDDELDGLIGQLSGRLAVLVFDSCNSGTIARGTPGASATPSVKGDARYLPTPEEAKRLGLGVTTRSGGGAADYVVTDEARILVPKTDKPTPQNPRDLQVVDTQIGGATAGVVVISAAQASQTAYSLEVGGKQRGALSAVFGEAPQPTLSALCSHLARCIAALQKSGRLRGNQRPACEMAPQLADKPLFAEVLTLPTLALANPSSALKVTLRSLEGKRQYRLDEDISYEVTTSAPGWLYLLVFSAENKATCVFPSKEEPDNYVKQGTHRLPRKDYFYAQEPLGKDVVIALLSGVKLDLGDKEDLTWDEVSNRLRSKRLRGYVNTRGVGTKKPGQPAPKSASLDEADWQAASLVIETIAKTAGHTAPAKPANARSTRGASFNPNRPKQR